MNHRNNKARLLVVVVC